MLRPLVLVLVLVLGAAFAAGLLSLLQGRDAGSPLALDGAPSAPELAPTPELAARPELPPSTEPEAAGPAPVEPQEERAPAVGVTRIEGVVLELSLDEPHDGAPAAGLEVVMSEGSLGPELARTRTGADGRFEFELAPGQAPRIAKLEVAGDARFRPERVSVRPARGETTSVVLRRAPHGTIAGTTVDEAGLPLVGVELSFGALEVGAPGFEVASGAGGRFELPGVEPRELRDAHLAGYVLASATPARRQPRGGFSPLEIVLARAGALEVCVLDAAGQGVAGVRVHVEPAAGLGSRASSRVPDRGSNTTAADGCTALDGVWADRPLRVQLGFGDSWLEAQGVVDGELVFARAPHAEAVQVGAGERVAFVARLGPSVSIEGVVYARDGSPAAGAKVLVFEPGRPVGGIERELQVSWPDARFSGSFTSADAPGELCVVASARSSDPRAPYRNTIDVATCTFPPGAGRHDIELRLGGSLPIEGRVTFPAGEAHSVHVRAVPTGSTELFARGRPGLDAETMCSELGIFTLGPLASGVYDLVVCDGYGGPGERVQVFPKIGAGSKGVELALDVARDVLVSFETADGAQVEQLTVIAVRVYPRRPGDVSPEHDLRIAHLDDFPDCGRIDFEGVQRWEDAGGTLRARRYQFDGRAGELRPMCPGWYVFGASARGPDGLEYALVSGGPYRLEAGVHSFEVELVPTGRLTVHLERDAPPGMAIALLDPAGRALPLQLRGGGIGSRAALSGSDRCRLVGVPAGSWRLAVGPEFELERGRALRTVDVTIAAGVATTLGLDLR